MNRFALVDSDLVTMVNAPMLPKNAISNSLIPAVPLEG